jgi:hypothetical protein
MITILGYLAFALLIATSVTLLLTRDWRVSVGALGIQYIGVTFLVGLTWPIGLAFVKVFAGWMAGAALGLSQAGQLADPQEYSWPGGRLFRSLAAVLVLLMLFIVSPQVAAWMPGVSFSQVWGGLGLIGMGFLHLGMTARPFRVILGLLTVLSGFEILYAAVEVSVLVAGLLAGVTLGLALVGAYFLTPPAAEEEA